MIYLASPFSHDNPWERERRALEVSELASKLMIKGYPIYCPIMNWWQCAKIQKFPPDFEWWMSLDCHFLSKCDAIFIAMMDGWRDSKGVQCERNFAVGHDMPRYNVGLDGRGNGNIYIFRFGDFGPDVEAFIIPELVKEAV